MRHDHVELARTLLRAPAPGPAAGRVRSRIGAVVDDVAMQVLQQVFAVSLRHGGDDAGVGAWRTGWQAHADAAARDPAPFYPRPAAPGVTRRKGARLPTGWIEDLTFQSDYAPGRAAARELLERYPENAVARVRHYRHATPGHPAVVCLHPWAGGRHAVDAALFRARWLYDLGLDVYLLVHPYHGARRPRRTLLRGTMHPSINVARTNEAFLQAAWEARALLALHLAQAGHGGGVVGASLGAYAAATLASVAAEVEFAVMLLPIADMAALLWWHGEGSTDRERVTARGLDFDRLCRLMAVHSPLAWRRPAVARERLLLVAGRGDRIAPAVHAEVLWAHWGRPAIHWFPGGHLTHFGRGGYLGAVREHLTTLGVVAGGRRAGADDLE